jgi:hypothetical protein
MSVQVWSPGEQVKGSVVVCRVADAAALRVSLGKNDEAIACFQVTPNGEVYIDLLRCFLAFRQDPNWVPSGDYQGNLDSAWIARNFQRLAFGLTNWDDSAATGAINILRQYETALHPQQVRFVEFCESLVKKVIRRILWGSPLSLSWPPTPSTRLWWQLNADLAQEITSHISDLKTCFHGSIPPVLQGLNIWLNQLHGRLVMRMFGTSREDAMLEASALCQALAAVHYSGSRYSLAALMSHRAADLLFTSICASQNLIDYTKAYGEGELKTAVGGKTELSLINCHDALEQASVILMSGTRRTQLLNLNLTRNRLLLTHSMGSTLAAETKTQLTAILGLLRAHGGSDWEAAFNLYRQGIFLRAQDFFELSDGLAQMLSPL